MSLIKRWFTAHWKLPLISLAVIAVGLAIALTASMAATHHTAGSITPSHHQAKHNISGVIARPTANRATGCLVTYTPSNWPGAFAVKVTIENRGTTNINGWTLTFKFPGDEAISSAWNTTFTQTGARVSAASTNYDATIARGASQSLGFLGTWASNDSPPTSFRVNGTACS